METDLYHCTSMKGLFGILKSQAFYPSFCLEKAEYLNMDLDFAFAMICFADLLPIEVESHMKKFKSSAYLKMSKEWAIKKGVTPVVYYNANSPLAACIRFIIERAREDLDKVHDPTNYTKAVNILLGYLKQYEGRYWIKNKNDWSDKTTFFTEREWRYVPLVTNGEANFLNSEMYKDYTFNTTKRKELIEHGYVLQFLIDDIKEIGISNEKDLDELLAFFQNNSFPYVWHSKIMKLYK